MGHIEPEKIPAHLARADVFVRPSRSEGLGNSFLEAMAAGLPVIGTKVGGIPDFLKEYNTNLRMGTNATNGENGLFTEVDNPKDLAGKIAFLINNDELCKKLGENGRKLVIGQYSWDNISKKMETIFNKSLEIRNLKLGINLVVPPLKYCLDNAVMIAAAAYVNELRNKRYRLEANGNLNL